MPKCERCDESVPRRHRAPCCGAMLCDGCKEAHDAEPGLPVFDAGALGDGVTVVLQPFSHQVGLRFAGLVLALQPDHATELGARLIDAGRQMESLRDAERGKAGKDA